MGHVEPLNLHRPRTRRRPRTDLELLLGVRAGSAAAFEELHHRYRAPLTRFARRILGAYHPAVDDVIQDVFDRAHRALTRWDGRELELRPWLYTLTQNRALDELRRARRAPVSLDAVEGERRAPDDVWSLVADRARLRETLADIAELPERQRSILLGRELEGRSHEEVAADMGITVQASKSLLLRARRNLNAAAVAREAPLSAIA